MHCQDQNLLHKKLVLEKFMSKKERDRDNEISIVIGCMWSNISGLLLLDECNVQKNRDKFGLLIKYDKQENWMHLLYDKFFNFVCINL